MINLENSDYGKADALVRRKLSLECGGRGRPPCHQLINPTLLQLPNFNILSLSYSAQKVLPEVNR